MSAKRLPWRPFLCVLSETSEVFSHLNTSKTPGRHAKPFQMPDHTFKRPLIEMRDVVKVYTTAAGEFNALKGINLQVGAGEFVGIVGKSGAGKSTLLNMITGVDHLTSGEVIVNSNGSSVLIHELEEDDIA